MTDANLRGTHNLRRGDVVEIQGPPSCGKTHLMYFFLIICITPGEHQSITVGGWDKGAVVFDMDASFDIIRFKRLLLGRLKQLFSFDIAQTVAQRSLERLHIFRPTSSTQLATSLTQLGRYHTTHLPGSEIGLVAIDSINAYCWPDRLIAEHMRSSPEQRRTSSSTFPPLCIRTALSSLRATHAPVVVMTSRGLQSTMHGVSALVDPLISTHQITLSTPQFQRCMPVATEEKHHQKEAVENVDILASMRLLKTSSLHSFTLHIAEDEVVASQPEHLPDKPIL